MTTRQLARLASHVLAWDAHPGCAVQITLNPIHGAATITIAANNGNMSAVVIRQALSRRQAWGMLREYAANMSACSCPICRANAAQAEAQAQAAASMPPPIADRLRFDGGHSGSVN